MSTIADDHDTYNGALKNPEMDRAITEIVRREKGEYDQLTVRCGLCDWSSTGTNIDTQQAAKTHRDTEHPREWETFRRNHVRRNSSAAVQWPKDRCLAFLVAWVTEHKRRPRMEDFAGKTTETRPNSAIIRRAFGESWKAAADAAIALAGLPEPEPKQKPLSTPKLRRPKETDMTRVAMSRDQMIEAMQTFYREEGIPPERRHFENDRKHGLPSMSPLKREFGGVIAARDAAGVPQPDHLREAPPSHAPSKAEVLEAMVRWHGEHGVMPRSAEWQQPGSVRGAYPNYDQSVKHGPWRGLVAEAVKSMAGPKEAEAPAVEPIEQINGFASTTNAGELVPAVPAEQESEQPAAEFVPPPYDIALALARIEGMTSYTSTTAESANKKIVRVREIAREALGLDMLGDRIVK